MADVYFFGCWRESGHFLYSKGGRMANDREVPDEFQMGKLDGASFNATPQTPYRYPPHQPLGVVRLQHIAPAEGGPVWTVLSMWDRSGDSRYNSNASFLTVGVFTVEEMWSLAEKEFPALVERIRAHRD